MRKGRNASAPAETVAAEGAVAEKAIVARAVEKEDAAKSGDVRTVVNAMVKVAGVPVAESPTIDVHPVDVIVVAVPRSIAVQLKGNAPLAEIRWARGNAGENTAMDVRRAKYGTTARSRKVETVQASVAVAIQDAGPEAMIAMAVVARLNAATAAPTVASKGVAPRWRSLKRLAAMIAA